MSKYKIKKVKPYSIGRVLAFQALYQEELNPHPFSSMEHSWEDLYDCYRDETGVSISAEEKVVALNFAQMLFEGVIKERSELDKALSETLDKRTLKHTTVVDRNILREATYEMCFIKTPKAIVISEAIELAKKFSERTSSAFLNGVLDQVDIVYFKKSASTIAQDQSVDNIALE